MTKEELKTIENKVLCIPRRENHQGDDKRFVMNEERLETVIAGLRFIRDACDKIREAGQCDSCPLFCLESDSFIEIDDFTSEEKWNEFFRFADKAEDPEEFERFVQYTHDETQRELDEGW